MTKYLIATSLLLAADPLHVASAKGRRRNYSREVRGGKRKLMASGWGGTGGMIGVVPTEEPTHGEDFFWGGEGENVAPPPVRVPTTPRPTSRLYVTMDPTKSPSTSPSVSPTPKPTPFPTNRPTPFPTWSPSWSPSMRPTRQPTNRPTPSPTNRPTPSPTPQPVNSLLIPSGWGSDVIGEIVETRSPTRRPVSSWGSGYADVTESGAEEGRDVTTGEFIDYGSGYSDSSGNSQASETVPVGQNGTIQVVVEMGSDGQSININVGSNFENGGETIMVDLPSAGQSSSTTTDATFMTYTSGSDAGGSGGQEDATDVYDYSGSTAAAVTSTIMSYGGFTTTGASSTIVSGSTDSTGAAAATSTIISDGGFTTTEASSTLISGGTDSTGTVQGVGSTIDLTNSTNCDDGVLFEEGDATDHNMTQDVFHTSSFSDNVTESSGNFTDLMNMTNATSNETLEESIANTGLNQHLSMVTYTCETLMNNNTNMTSEVISNENPVEIEFSYEVAVSQGVAVDDLVQTMDEKLAKHVGLEVLDCDGLREGRSLEQSVVNGIGNSPDFVTDQQCSYFTAEAGTLPADAECHVVNGRMTLYLNGTERATISEEVHALLEVALNKDAGEYLDAIQGLEGLHYDGVPTPEPVSLRSTGSDEESETLSPIWIGGITMISAGSLAVFAAIIFMVRRKKAAKAPETFDKLQDDHSFDSTKDETAETRDFFVDIMINTDEDSFGNTLGNEAALGYVSSAKPGDIPSYMKNTEAF